MSAFILCSIPSLNRYRLNRTLFAGPDLIGLTSFYCSTIFVLQCISIQKGFFSSLTYDVKCDEYYWVIYIRNNRFWFRMCVYVYFALFCKVYTYKATWLIYFSHKTDNFFLVTVHWESDTIILKIFILFCKLNEQFLII